MKKVLVLYDSATGNTRKMAQLVAEGATSVEDTEVRLKSADEAAKADILWCDGVAVGSPTNMGILSWKMKKFWDDLGNDLWGRIDGKLGCAFSSSTGGVEGMNSHASLYLRCCSTTDFWCLACRTMLENN